MAGTSYTRQSTLTDGDTITAALFNDEYNKLVSAFAYTTTGTTGHRHDGTTAEGGNMLIALTIVGEFMYRSVVQQLNRSAFKMVQLYLLQIVTLI